MYIMPIFMNLKKHNCASFTFTIWTIHNSAMLFSYTWFLRLRAEKMLDCQPPQYYREVQLGSCTSRTEFRGSIHQHCHATLWFKKMVYAIQNGEMSGKIQKRCMSVLWRHVLTSAAQFEFNFRTNSSEVKGSCLPSQRHLKTPFHSATLSVIVIKTNMPNNKVPLMSLATQNTSFWSVLKTSKSKVWTPHCMALKRIT